MSNWDGIQIGTEEKVFKVFWAWQDDQEEAWLGEMAKSGMHLSAVMPFVYTFSKGIPEDYVYRLDFKNILDKDYPEYQTIFKDSGWELVTVMSNWHYYRIRPDNESVPEIYNDNLSKSVKYQRLLGLLLPFFPIFVLVLPPSFIIEGRPYDGLWWDAVMVLGLALKSFWIYAIIRVSLKIIQLRKG